MARMSVKWPMAGIMSGLVILATAAAPAEARFGGPGGRGSIQQLQAELGLTDDQVKAIREAHERQRASRRQVGKAMGEARRGLQELVMRGADDAAVQAKAAEVERLFAQAVGLRIQALRDLSSVLTPEQREQLLLRRPGRRPAILAPAS